MLDALLPILFVLFGVAIGQVAIRVQRRWTWMGAEWKRSKEDDDEVSARRRSPPARAAQCEGARGETPSEPGVRGLMRPDSRRRCGLPADRVLEVVRARATRRIGRVASGTEPVRRNRASDGSLRELACPSR